MGAGQGIERGSRVACNLCRCGRGTGDRSQTAPSARARDLAIETTVLYLRAMYITGGWRPISLDRRPPPVPPSASASASAPGLWLTD